MKGFHFQPNLLNLFFPPFVLPSSSRFRNTWKTRNTGMKKTWRKNWRVLKVSPLSSFRAGVFAFFSSSFCLPLSICLFVGSLRTHASLQDFFFVFLCGKRQTAVIFQRGLQGQVLSGLGGMCSGVSLLVVTIFRTFCRVDSSLLGTEETLQTRSQLREQNYTIYQRAPPRRSDITHVCSGCMSSVLFFLFLQIFYL